jgi:methylated-DNA-[protein]-cysteine S-methyltransferase
MIYQIIKAGKDEIGLVWDNVGNRPRVESVYLPHGKEKISDRIRREYPGMQCTQRRIPDDIDNVIIALFKGQNKKVSLSAINLKKLTGFQTEVLKQVYQIPHGKAATYSGIAARTGHPRAARAVGTVMANNPFPLIIPCHRVIRADRKVGQFGGGTQMKRELLEREGVIFGRKGIISGKYIQF